jgi:hypothetical protein
MSRSLACLALLLSLVFAGGCSQPAPDLSAHGDPAPRLIGHWATDAKDQLFYGPIDTASGQGSYTLIHPDGKVFRHAYRIRSTDPARQAVQATYLFADGDTAPVAFVLSADGRTLTSTQEITGMQIDSDAKRVDDRTAP